MEKQRIGVKLMINNEIDKMKNLNIDTRYEFKRVNGILKRVQDITKVLMEEALLS
jgi:hypothetical protein